MTQPTYKQMKTTFKEWFSTGYMPSIQMKFKLIDLIAWLVYELRKKKPDVTYYQIVNKLAQGLGFNDKDIYAIAIMSEDFAYMCDDFLKYDLKLNEVPGQIRELLKKVMPF